jgi:hypothetical protein
VSALALEPRLFDPPGPQATLDQRLVAVWDALTGRSVVECPVCSGGMEPEYGVEALQPDDSAPARSGGAGGRAGRKPEGGLCRGCGSTLT